MSSPTSTFTSSPASSGSSSSQELPEPSNVNAPPLKIRKKPGRKPNPASPALRKAQNRTAQRAFRERKERHLRELEETIKQLREEHAETVDENAALKRMLEGTRSNQAHLMSMVMRLQGCLRENCIPLPVMPRNFDKAIIVSAGEDDGLATTGLVNPNEVMMMSGNEPELPNMPSSTLAASTSFESILRSSLASTPVIEKPSPVIPMLPSPPRQLLSNVPDSRYFYGNQLAVGERTSPMEDLFDDEFIQEDEAIYGDAVPFTPLADELVMDTGAYLQSMKGENIPPVEIRFHPTTMDKQQQISMNDIGEMQNGAGQFIRMRIMLH